MTEAVENNPPSLGLMREVIINLNIARRNIKAYPRDHPAVQKSLSNVYDAFLRLFELSTQNTLVVGKDTLIANDVALEKKNAIYKQLAHDLRGLGIAYITFSQGMTLDDLYKFNLFISSQEKFQSHRQVREALSNYGISHIEVSFIDYDAFSFEEGKTIEEISQEDLWDQYISALLAGTLTLDHISEEIGNISLDVFAHLLRRISEGRDDGGLTKKILAVYLKKYFRRPFPDGEIRKMLDFMETLDGNLKQQFARETVDVLSEDIAFTTKLLQDISADTVIELYKSIRSREVALPEILRKLLDSFLHGHDRPIEFAALGGGFLVDDILIPADILRTSPKGEMGETLSDTLDTAVSGEYEADIKKIMEFDPSDTLSITLQDLKKEIDDDCIQKNYNMIVLELMSSNLISEKEYRQFIENLKEQSLQFVLTGQYGQVLKIIKLLRLNKEQERFLGITSDALAYYYGEEFLSAFTDSLRIMGQQSRDEAWELCENYGEVIIPNLMDMLISADSRASRSLLLGLIRQFGEGLVPEAVKRLDDPRWFVKRNMLYLLSGCRNKELIPTVRKYCDDENQKVSVEAVKCLLSMEDGYGIDMIKKSLASGSKEQAEQAIALAGAYRLKDMVPDLIQILEGTATSKENVHLKVAVIKALGSLGDTRSLESFKKIVFSKRIFFKGLNEVLKEEIYRTLKNYPYPDIEDMVQAGLKSRNEDIKTESLRLRMMRHR